MSSLPPPPGDLPPPSTPAEVPLPPPLPADSVLPPPIAPPHVAPPPPAPQASVRISVEPSPKPRRTGLWLGLLAVVAIGVAVTVAVVAADGDESVAVAATITLDGTGALDTWQAIVGDIDFDAGDNGSGGEMERCPFGDLEHWAANAPDSLRDPLADVADEDAYLEVFVTNLESEEQYLVQCLYYDERTETQVGIAITERLDMDYRQEVAELLPDFDLDFDPDRDHAGGTLVTYCANTDPTSDLLSFCEADWYDDDILVNVFYTDEQATADDVTAWLQASLPDWLQDFEDADLDDIDATTVTY